MKKLIITILSVSCIFTACKKDKQTFEFGIDVQSSFDNDKVQVSIDNIEVLNKNLTTNHLIGVCNGGTILLRKNPNNYILKVIVNNSIIKTDTFFLIKNIYIGIDFDPSTNEIYFEQADIPFVYE